MCYPGASETPRYNVLSQLTSLTNLCINFTYTYAAAQNAGRTPVAGKLEPPPALSLGGSQYAEEIFYYDPAGQCCLSRRDGVDSSCRSACASVPMIKCAARGTPMNRQGNGKKERLILIGKRALAWIDKYIREAQPELPGAAEDGAVFLMHLGAPLERIQLAALVRCCLTYRGHQAPDARMISEVIADLKARGSDAVIDDAFARDIEAGIEAQRQPWAPPSWE